jgi:molybdate transport system ATP-binding protein
LLRIGNTSLSSHTDNEGVFRVTLLIDASTPPLTAEITEASVTRLHLHEGSTVYATFKATEARAYT